MTGQGPVDQARETLRQEQDRIAELLKSEKSRVRGTLLRRMHEIRQMLDPQNQYMSQAGQDVVVDRFFKGKRGGTFLDIGGYDGITGSNSWFFEKILGWAGALVEPVGVHLERAKMLRSCTCLGYAVSDTEGEAEFIAVTKGFTQMSGLSGSYDKTILDRVRADPRHSETKVIVPTKPISAIIEEAGLLHPDFISLDIEGGELTALQGFPFDKYNVGAWAIENNTGTPAIAVLMRAHGYQLSEFCGQDEIYFKS